MPIPYSLNYCSFRWSHNIPISHNIPKWASQLILLLFFKDMLLALPGPLQLHTHFSISLSNYLHTHAFTCLHSWNLDLESINYELIGEKCYLHKTKYFNLWTFTYPSISLGLLKFLSKMSYSFLCKGLTQFLSDLAVDIWNSILNYIFKKFYLKIFAGIEI